QQRLPVLGKYLRAGWHRDDDIFPGRTRAVLAHAVLSPSGGEMLAVAVVDEGVEIGDAGHPHIAALATRAPIGSAEFDELLTAKGDAARTAVAGLHVNFGLIKEFHENRRRADASQLESIEPDAPARTRRLFEDHRLQPVLCLPAVEPIGDRLDI